MLALFSGNCFPHEHGAEGIVSYKEPIICFVIGDKLSTIDGTDNEEKIIFIDGRIMFAPGNCINGITCT